MDTSAKPDQIAQGFSKEGGPSGSQDVPTGTSLWSTTALYNQRQDTTEDLPENASAAVRQSEDHLPFASTAWKLGYEFIDQHEYGQAIECFRRMLLPADALAEPLYIEAAEIAAQLCVALSHKRWVEEKLQDASRVLGQDLSQLSYEEVSFARDALAACEGAGFPAAYHALQAYTPSEATEMMTAGSDLPSVEVSNSSSWGSWPGSPEVSAYVPDQPCLRVRFFGRFELLRDGEVVYLGRNARALSILKYLLARRGRPVTRDYLMGWLWPESDLKRARWSLNSAVCSLRKLLGDSLPSLPASETVLYKEDSYQLSPHVRLSADTDEFDSCYEEGRRLEEAGWTSEAVAQYEKAVELYRGDYLIEDLYEEWTVIERERLVDAYADLLRRLAVHYMETGQPQESVRTCYRILEKDRCDEEAHRLLMESFVCLGQRGRALRQYRLCEQVLRHECDMMPSPKTRALYASILKEGSP